MRPLSDLDRMVIAKHQAGASINSIAEEAGIKRVKVKHIIEHVARIHAKGQAILAKDPENLDALRMTGELSQRAYSALANATYHVDVPDLERVSDVAAQGRQCIARLPSIGVGVMAELDVVLARFGLAWNSRSRPFAYRTSENRHPLMESWDDERERHKQQELRNQHWNDILRRVAEMERSLGTGVLKDSDGRDSAEGVVYRLAFLNGYLESLLERERKTIDVTPDPEQGDSEYETAGNLICLPGVKLADIQPDGGRS